MPRLKLITPPWQAHESVDSGQASSSLIDGILTDQGALAPRPGLMRYKRVETYASRCLGVFWWEAKGVLVVAYGGRLYASTCTGSLTFTHINSAAPGSSSSTHIFAATEHWLYVASGGQLIRWNGSLSSAAEYDTSAASLGLTAFSHVAYIDGYIVGSITSSQSWYYAELAVGGSATDALTWQATGLTAEGSPDSIKALLVSWREVLIVGSESTEVWYDSGDATTPFQRLEGAFIEQGTQSPYTIAEADNTWIWLNEKKQVIRLQGRTPTLISTPIRKELENIQYVADAIGFMLWEYYVLSFPRANITWVYDLQKQCWYRWGAWDSAQYLYNQFKGKFAAWSPKFGVHFLGGDDGYLYITDRSIGTDDGALIRTEFISRPVDHDTLRYKFCSSIQARYKRGSNNEGETLGRFLEQTETGVYLPVLAIGQLFYFQWERFSLLGTANWVWAWTPLPSGLTFTSATRELTADGSVAPISSTRTNSILTLTHPTTGFVLQFPIILEAGVALTPRVKGTREIELFFQDDGQTWSRPISMDAGEVGDMQNIREFAPGGQYATRRYKLVFPATINVAFGDLSEEVELES